MFRSATSILGIAILLGASSQEEGGAAAESPWGVAPSHSSSRGIESWAGPIAETGVDWMRGFYQGESERVLAVAAKNGYQVSGILQAPASFPVDALPEWKQYVADSIKRTRGKVRYWEVWNEPPNFSQSKSPVDYAKIVVAAYQTAKEVDPTVQVGLAAQSVNLNFLAQALDAGAAGHFDYVTVHPYETLDLVASGWEAQYLSIVPTIRKLLADKSPGKKDVPVWFTEVGEPVQKGVTPQRQADTLVKAYVLGLAQGVLRIHWFEPIDGDSGPFGLIAGGSGSGSRRPSVLGDFPADRANREEAALRGLADARRATPCVRIRRPERRRHGRLGPAAILRKGLVRRPRPRRRPAHGRDLGSRLGRPHELSGPRRRRSAFPRGGGPEKRGPSVPLGRRLFRRHVGALRGPADGARAASRRRRKLRRGRGSPGARHQQAVGTGLHSGPQFPVVHGRADQDHGGPPPERRGGGGLQLEVRVHVGMEGHRELVHRARERPLVYPVLDDPRPAVRREVGLPLLVRLRLAPSTAATAS